MKNLKKTLIAFTFLMFSLVSFGQGPGPCNEEICTYTPSTDCCMCTYSDGSQANICASGGGSIYSTEVPGGGCAGAFTDCIRLISVQ